MTAPSSDRQAYELIVGAASCSLTLGGEVMWCSDGDDDFLEEFGEELIDYDDEAQCDDVIEWLVQNEYIPPDTDVEVIEEGDELGESDA